MFSLISYKIQIMQIIFSKHCEQKLSNVFIVVSKTNQYFNSLTVAVPYTGRLTLLQYITIKS